MWQRLARREFAIAAVLAAVGAVRGNGQGPISETAVPLTLLAILAAFLAAPRHGAARAVWTRSRPDRAPLLAAVLLSVPAMVAVVLWWQEPFAASQTFTQATSTIGAGLWIAGMAAGLLLLWRPAWRGAVGAWLHVPRGMRRWEFAALALMLVAALLARVWRLDTEPEGIWFDETDSVNSAARLLSMPFQAFGPGNAGHNCSLYFYLMALTIRAGRGMLGVRLASASFGVVAVFGVYLLGRRLGGSAYALCAAALLAFSAWAIDFSRLAMPNIAAPAMLSCGFFFLALALERPLARYFAACGVVCGLSLMTYAGALLAAVLVPLLLLTARSVASGSFRRQAWPAVLWLPLGFLVGAAPYLTMLVMDPGYTLAREQTVSIMSEYAGWLARAHALGANLQAHLLMFTIRGDANGRHNLPGAPMLDYVTGGLFLLGLGDCLRRLRDWRVQFLLVWLAASMASGVFTVDFEAPQGARTLGATAPVALIAALPLAYLARQARVSVWQYARCHRLWLRCASFLLPAVLACLLLVSGALNLDRYFVRQQASMESWQAMDGLQALLGRVGRSLQDQGFSVRVSPDLVGDAGMAYAAGGVKFPAYDRSVPVPLPVPRGGVAVLVPVGEQAVYAALHGTYPTARVERLHPAGIPGVTAAYAVLVRARDVAATLGATVTLGPRVPARMYSHVHAMWSWPSGLGPHEAVQVRFTLMLGQGAGSLPSAVRAFGLPGAAVCVDGRCWAGQAGMPALVLGAGNHAVLLSANRRVGPQLRLQWRVGVAGWVPLPALLVGGPGLPVGGVLGRYYAGSVLGITPVLTRVDSGVNIYYQNPPAGLSFPFAVRWSGTLHPPVAGTYGFSLDTVGPSSLWLDGKLVLASGVGQGMQNVSLPLAARAYSVRLEYHAVGGYLHAYLLWQPPAGTALVPVPTRVLSPL